MERVASSAELVKSELKLILVGNGGGGGAVNFGDTLRYSLFFENRSQMALSDIILSLRLEGSPAVGGRSPLVWETISDEAGAKRTGDTLTWTKKQISALGRLEPGEQGTADIAIELVPVPFSKGGTDYKVVAFGEAKIGKIGGARSDRVARSEPLEMKLFSDLVFIAEGRYYDDDDNAVGAGPAPPRVGETTFYRIWWTLANTLHDLEELKVESVLPPGVNFTGRFNSEDAGELSYDEKTRKVVWKIEKLKGAKEPVRAEFEVSITPAEDQLGSTVVLTDLASASGRDTALDALIFRTVPQITSNIETDPNLAGKGTVRR
ncbi:MAG: hypothetical protein HYS76_01755 [Candidatus Wildermuthbacteria bacterium]|nr:hypothetical protein [Candidatus Wildermuthbacteria bacterium]